MGPPTPTACGSRKPTASYLERHDLNVHSRDHVCTSGLDCPILCGGIQIPCRLSTKLQPYVQSLDAQSRIASPQLPASLWFRLAQILGYNGPRTQRSNNASDAIRVDSPRLTIYCERHSGSPSQASDLGRARRVGFPACRRTVRILRHSVSVVLEPYFPQYLPKN